MSFNPFTGEGMYSVEKSKSQFIGDSLKSHNLAYITEGGVSSDYDVRLTLASNGDLEVREYFGKIKTKVPFSELMLSSSDSFDSLLDSSRDSFISSLSGSEISDIIHCREKSGRQSSCSDGVIRSDSLLRTRNDLIGYASEHESDWKSFLTLTFSDIVSLDDGNVKFRNFIKQIRKTFPDLMYLCVPEYQKRGSIHYHLLTNLPCDSVFIPKRDLKKLWSDNEKKWRFLEYYDIPYWSHGFSSAFDINLADDKFNIALYITKYLYKDIDNRLFGRNKILKSNNLRKPFVDRLNKNNTCFQIAMNYIQKKYGNSISRKSYPQNQPYQVPFVNLKCKLSQEDINTVIELLKEEVPY